MRWVAEGNVFGPTSAPPAASVVERHAVAADAVSATLGWLYLEQGHLDDAEATFERVLAQRPGDARARQGQQRVTRLRGLERRIGRLRRFAEQVQRADE